MQRNAQKCRRGICPELRQLSLAVIYEPSDVMRLFGFSQQDVEVSAHLAHAAEDAFLLVDQIKWIPILHHLAFFEDENLVIIYDCLIETVSILSMPGGRRDIPEDDARW